MQASQSQPRIDRRLNIVIPMETESGDAYYVHSTPIGRAVFEQYFLPISKAFTAIYRENLGIVAGPRVAMLLLKQVSEEMGVWDGPSGVQQGLVNEIHRLTNVLVLGEGSGWRTLSFDDAVAQQIISADDKSEVDNALAFFTCVSSVGNRHQISNELSGMIALWGAQTTSLNSTAFANSLPTWTGTDSSGETETTS